MNLNQIAEYLKTKNKYNSCITHWEEIPAREAEFVEFPEKIDYRLKKVLQEKG